LLRVLAERNPATKAAVNSVDEADMLGDDALTVAGITIDSSATGTGVPHPRTIRPPRVPHANPARSAVDEESEGWIGRVRRPSG
jgi:hypothetical protein